MIGGLGAVHLKPSVGGAGETGLAGSGASAAGGGATTFAEALGQAASKTVGTLQNAESVAIRALSGDADTRQVVDAVMSAQQALQTAVSIRDKIVSAYLEISRMGI